MSSLFFTALLAAALSTAGATTYDNPRLGFRLETRNHFPSPPPSHHHPFPNLDDHHWEHGRWHHGHHHHRLGWWWIVNDNWHRYDEPVYPYPAPSLTLEFSSRADRAASPPLSPSPSPSPPSFSPARPPAAAAAPPVEAKLPTAEDPTVYYCASARAYYPAVPSCREGWQEQDGKPLL